MNNQVELLQKKIKSQNLEKKQIIEAHSKFISVLSHDIKNRITPLLLLLNGLAKRINRDTHTHDYIAIKKVVGMAANSANKTEAIFKDLLKWSISQKEEIHANPIALNLSELIMEQVLDQETVSSSKQVEIKHCIPSHLFVLADKKMVEIILRSLIHNGIKYSNSGDIVEISCNSNNRFAEIAVKDSGVGIPSDKKKDLFKKTALNSSKGTDNEKGTGLGLLICKEFVELNGGKIWISKTHRKGSIFKFTLPLQTGVF